MRLLHHLVEVRAELEYFLQRIVVLRIYAIGIRVAKECFAIIIEGELLSNSGKVVRAEMPQYYAQLTDL